mmetsp:Transcript_73981/g.138225  ORF Transcript_73981/g.138225 Transcript_73981/m.138225 type:complete len:217 (-) Transcript_73981:154-804(-)
MSKAPSRAWTPSCNPASSTGLPPFRRHPKLRSHCPRPRVFSNGGDTGVAWSTFDVVWAAISDCSTWVTSSAASPDPTARPGATLTGSGSGVDTSIVVPSGSFVSGNLRIAPKLRAEGLFDSKSATPPSYRLRQHKVLPGDGGLPGANLGLLLLSPPNVGNSAALSPSDWLDAKECGEELLALSSAAGCPFPCGSDAAVRAEEQLCMLSRALLTAVE